MLSPGPTESQNLENLTGYVNPFQTILDSDKLFTKTFQSIWGSLLESTYLVLCDPDNSPGTIYVEGPWCWTWRLECFCFNEFLSFCATGFSYIVWCNGPRPSGAGGFFCRVTEIMEPHRNGSRDIQDGLHVRKCSGPWSSESIPRQWV